MTVHDRSDHSQPMSVEELAAFDADALDPTRAAAVRSAAATDPRARQVLAALAATRAALAGLRDPEVPPEIAARWTAALEEAAQERGEAQMVAPPRRVRPRPVGWVLAAAAAVIGCALAAVSVLAPRHDTRQEQVLALAHVDVASAGPAAVGATDFGELTDPARRAECLRSVGLDTETPVVGGRRVLLDGRPGVLLVLATGKLGTFRLLVVDESCGPRGGTVLADETLGG